MEYQKNPVKAIRKFCLECIGGPHYVQGCTSKGCHIYPFRMGKNPYRTKRKMTDEQKQAATERLKNARVKIGGKIC